MNKREKSRFVAGAETTMNENVAFSEEEVLRRIQGLDDATAKSVVCALIGHSRIVTMCFGYVSCARCEAQIGDTLGGASTTKDNVIVGHNCPTCRSNALSLTWRDRMMTPDPFAAEAAS